MNAITQKGPLPAYLYAMLMHHDRTLKALLKTSTEGAFPFDFTLYVAGEPVSFSIYSTEQKVAWGMKWLGREPKTERRLL